MLKVVDNLADVTSDADLRASYNTNSPGSINNISVNKLMPYRLTEQFRINVQKEDEPSVRFHSVLYLDFW